MAAEQELPPFPMLLDDEPISKAILFDFDKKSEDLSNILSMDIKSPFSILLNGEWGAGKTSLMKTVYDKLKPLEGNKNWKILWFNAWQYEGFDPRSALFTQIIQAFRGESLTKLTGILKKLPSFNFGINLGLVSLSTDSEKLIQQYVENIDKLDNLHSFLQEEVVNGKLIVFIDDLDRCSFENTLSILESIKIFLSIRNSIFVVGADIQKLERAWELRYGKTMTQRNESKNHIDKIFQLSINLPGKDFDSMKKFLKKLDPDNKVFGEGVYNLVVQGSKANPRSFKRIINLANILWFLANKYTVKVDDKQILMSIAIICIQYPELLKVIKKEPQVFFELAFLAINYFSYPQLVKYEKQINGLDFADLDGRNQAIKTSTLEFKLSNFSSGTVEGLKYLLEDENAFYLMRVIGENYSYHGLKSEIIRDVQSNKRNEMSQLVRLLGSTSLFI